MTDIFEAVVRKWKGSPAIVMLFLASLVMLIIGVNHFAEDTVSSKLGLQSLENAFNMNVQIWDWTYWTMSLTPQIASVVFFYMFLSDTKRYEYLAVSGFAQLADFMADAWYRSNGHFFQDGANATAASIITFVFFGVGSEFFVTVGGGLVLRLFAPALASWKQTWNDIRAAGKGQYRGSSNPTPSAPPSMHQPRPEPRPMMPPSANDPSIAQLRDQSHQNQPPPRGQRTQSGKGYHNLNGGNK